ncbi:MAG: hypothetical protein U1E97_10065 [Alphaproteobacteria bacterium]
MTAVAIAKIIECDADDVPAGAGRFLGDRAYEAAALIDRLDDMQIFTAALMPVLHTRTTP